MKNKYRLVFLNIFLSLAFSYAAIGQSPCDNTIPLKCDRPTTGGIDNPVMFLSSDDAKTYVTNYREKFNRSKKRKRTHTRSFYITKETFCFMDNFLKDKVNDAFTGIHITLANYNELIIPTMLDPKQITMFFTPATSDKQPNYTAFVEYAKSHCNSLTCDGTCPPLLSAQDTVNFFTANHGELCPEKCDNFTDGWGPPIPLATSKTNTIDAKPGKPSPVEFLTPEEARAFTINYRKDNCSYSKRKHSKSIYLKEANFRFIGEFFKTHPKYDAIRIFFVSYNQPDMIPGQQRKKQISILIVPACGKNGEPDFCAFNEYLRSGMYSDAASLAGKDQVELSTAKIF